MKKASQILLLVGGILAFVVAWSYFFCGLSCILAGALGTSKLFEFLAEQGFDLAQYVPEEAVAACAITMGVFWILWSGVAIANGVVALLGRKKQTKVFYILNIVFGLLSGVEVNGVGGVFGLFTLPKKEEVQE